MATPGWRRGGHGHGLHGTAHHGHGAPPPASVKVLAPAGLQLSQMDIIELNEAFAAQGLALARELGLQDE